MPEVPDGMLDANGAASYLNISVEEFLAEVQMGHLPSPDVRGWRRNALDKWVFVQWWSEFHLAHDAALWRLRGVPLSVTTTTSHG